jgi:hypothetical protein
MLNAPQIQATSRFAIVTLLVSCLTFLGCLKTDSKSSTSATLPSSASSSIKENETSSQNHATSDKTAEVDGRDSEQLGLLGSNNGSPIEPQSPDDDFSYEPIDSAKLIKRPDVGFNREWNSADGKFGAKAMLTGIQNASVVLKKPDGGIGKVEIKRLSAADIDYINSVVLETKGRTLVFGTVLAGDSTSHGFNFDSIHGDRYQANLEGVAFPKDAFQASELYRQVLELVHTKSGWIEVTDVDTSKPLNAILFVDGVNINLRLIADGIARYDDTSNLGNRYHNAELIARQDKLGIWGRPSN